MHQVDKFFQESYYNILRVLLIPCGIWPFQTPSKRYVMYVVFTVLFGFGICFEMLCCIKLWPDFFAVFDCLSMLFFAFSSTIKLIYTVFKLSTVKILVMNIYEYWCSPKLDQEAKILHSYMLFARKIGYVYSGILLGLGVIFALTPLVSKFFYNKENASNKTQDAEIESTYGMNYMLDLQMEYNSLLIQGMVCEVYFVLIMASITVMYIVFVEHCCGLFEALRYRLESAFDFGNNDDDFLSTQNKCYSNIAYSVRRHVEAIQFATIIDSLFRLPFFMHMTVNVSLLSIVGFQMITDPENVSRLMPYSAYLSGLMVNMFIENWLGQKIMDCNERVCESAYV